jgi:DNA-binding XRE family transcriptional regulator
LTSFHYSPKGITIMAGGSKYKPLQIYLEQSDRPEVTLSFQVIETLIGEALPPTARTQRAWWSNRSKGALQATAWMNAGFLVKQLDLDQEIVIFSKPAPVYAVPQADGTVQWTADLVRALRRHMGVTQAQFARELGIRQQTVSEWEKGVYAPTRATSNHLSLVAEKVQFAYTTDSL